MVDIRVLNGSLVTIMTIPKNRLIHNGHAYHGMSTCENRGTKKDDWGFVLAIQDVTEPTKQVPGVVNGRFWELSKAIVESITKDEFAEAEYIHNNNEIYLASIECDNLSKDIHALKLKLEEKLLTIDKHKKFIDKVDSFTTKYKDKYATPNKL